MRVSKHTRPFDLSPCASTNRGGENLNARDASKKSICKVTLFIEFKQFTKLTNLRTKQPIPIKNSSSATTAMTNASNAIVF